MIQSRAVEGVFFFGMNRISSQSLFHSFLFGGASVLLALDLFFLVRSMIGNNFVPIVPIVAGVLITGGLLLVLYAEAQTRELDKREHRRLTRVAHQLESPLSNLQEDIAYLVSRADSLPAEERLKLKRMETKAGVLLENVRDVFLLFRAEQGPVAQQARDYDLCALVPEAVRHVTPLASAHNVEITQKAHCDKAVVRVDRQLFLIALVHLLENAILYSLTPGLVNVALIKGRSNIRLVVQDRGIGVKPADIPAIFLPFARGDKADHYDPDGIGVGLTLSRHIIREFGGELVWRNRADNTGSEFEIKLPLATKARQ